MFENNATSFLAGALTGILGIAAVACLRDYGAQKAWRGIPKARNRDNGWWDGYLEFSEAGGHPENLEQSLSATPHDLIVQGGVYALIGPTGVGKTTTAAKLAARCVLRHGANKVALVTMDDYRVGAYEQLQIYGRILGIAVYLAKDTEELRQTLRELANKHMVMIDTPGMSQKDRLVAELNNMLSACNVRRLLLLSATMRDDTLDEVIRAYRGDNIAGCILTKIDEATTLAPVIDTIIRHGLNLEYVSNGRRVPEDLRLPDRIYSGPLK